MSQLQNLVQVFQNNDLVTAAKLNALVTQTTLANGSVTEQATATSGLASTDVVLGHQASNNALVQIPIQTIRETGLSLKTQTIEPLSSVTLEIKTGDSTTDGTHYPTDILIDSADGETEVMGKTVTLGNEGIYDREVVSGGNHRFKAATIVEGAPVTAKMTSIVGNPSITIQVFAASATAIPHGFSIGDVIDVVGPTAEFTGAFTIISSNFSSTSFMVTLPANATTAHNAVLITATRPALKVSNLAQFDRLRVTGKCEFLGGLGGTFLKEIVEETIPVGTPQSHPIAWTTFWTSASYVKPAGEIWVIEADIQLYYEIQHYGAMRILQTSNTTMLDSEFTIQGGGMNYYHHLRYKPCTVIGSATTFTSTFKFDMIFTGSTGSMAVGRTNFAYAPAIFSSINVSPSKFRIYKFVA